MNNPNHILVSVLLLLLSSSLAQADDRPLYWASLDNGGNRSEAMRDEPWKLVVSHPQAPQGSFENEQVELYRLDQDPSEKTDLAGEHADRAAAMLTRLKAWYADTQKNTTLQVGGWLKAGRQ